MQRRTPYFLAALLLIEAIVLSGEFRLLAAGRADRAVTERLVRIRRETKEVTERKAVLIRSKPVVAIRHGGYTLHVLTPEEDRRFRQVIAEQGSPECNRLTRIEELAELRIRYAPLIRKLGLNAEQAAKLLQLLSDQRDLPMDLNKAAVDQHMSMDEFRKAMANETSQVEAAIQALIGPEKIPQLQFYQSHLGTYLLVSEVQQVLGAQADHLSDAQADELTQILLAHPSPADPAPGSFRGERAAVVIPFLTPTWFRADAYSSGMPPGGQPNDTVAGYNLITRYSGDVYVDATGGIDSNYGLSGAAIQAAASLLSAEQVSALRQIANRQAAEREIATSYHAL